MTATTKADASLLIGSERPLPGGYIDPAASRTTVSIGEIDGCAQPALSCQCLPDQLRVDLVEHQLCPPEHAETTEPVDITPCEVQEASAGWAMDGGAFEVVRAVVGLYPNIDSPFGDSGICGN